MVFYHSSPASGIELFTPRISTHGIPVVYGAKSIDSVLLYCAKWNDFMITCGSDDVIVERYQGAFNELYKDKKGYIYVLDGSTFEYDETCKDYVSKVPVKVIDCIIINRLYDVIMAKYDVYLYPHKPPWVPEDDSDIVPHTMKLYHMCHDKGLFPYVINHFPHLAEAFDNELKRNHISL